MSDPAIEEALYNSTAMGEFARNDLGNQPAPNETTICKFRHLLEKHQLVKKTFQEVNAHLNDRGVKISGGMIVDAKIIHALISTKMKPKRAGFLVNLLIPESMTQYELKHPVHETSHINVYTATVR